jgi:hypothetical protein
LCGRGDPVNRKEDRARLKKCLQGQDGSQTRIIKAGNCPASPVYIGQEKVEKSSAMMKTKQIPAGQ